MKGFIKKGAVIVVAGMLLTGCGEEVVTLTESEEAVIVNYASGTVAKFNKRQMDGMTAVVWEEEEEAEEEEPVTEDEKELTEEQDEKKQDETQSQEPSGEETVTEEEKDLVQVLGVQGVEVKYTGYELNANYEESDYFSMVAAEGNTYFVMKFTLTNTGSEEVACDILSKKPIFTVSLNGNTAHKNEVTLLPNDLSTYTMNLAAGESAEAVLIFEVPLEETTDITSIQTGVEVNGVRGNVVM